jgi:hypothetical protein
MRFLSLAQVLARLRKASRQSRPRSLRVPPLSLPPGDMTADVVFRAVGVHRDFRPADRRAHRSTAARSASSPWRSAVSPRRPRCTSTRPIAAVSIPSGISPDMPGFSRPMRCGVQHGLQAGANAGSDHRSGMRVRGASLRACRHRLDGARQDEALISPIAFEAVQKIDAIVMLERSIKGSPHRMIALFC